MGVALMSAERSLHLSCLQALRAARIRTLYVALRRVLKRVEESTHTHASVVNVKAQRRPENANSLSRAWPRWLPPTPLS